MKIYDAFLFFNELEILELRMNILNDVVDYFVIVESTVTFSSNHKQLLFHDNRHLFDKFKDKIIHVVIDDSPSSFLTINYLDNPTTDEEVLKNKILKYVDESPNWPRHETHWGVETYQRESIIKGLINCDEDDIVIISDVDEIPNPNEVEKMKNMGGEVVNFNQNMYFYYLNLLKEKNWPGPKACAWGKLNTISLNSLRQNKHTTKTISDGGWHFSFMGGEAKVIEKIEAYAHQEFNKPYYKENVKDNIINNNDPFFRGKLTQVVIDETFPLFLLNNLEKYKHMVKH